MPVPSSLPAIFDIGQPREDVLAGRVADADFAADLASVIAGTASAEYSNPARFFANTYPTRGLRDLLANLCARLRGAGEGAATIFRLDTTYGGGKTYGLFAIRHVAAPAPHRLLYGLLGDIHHDDAGAHRRTAGASF